MNPQQPSGPVSYNSSSSGGNKLLLVVALGILLIISLVFGIWSFKQMQDYKDSSNNKVTAAVDEAKKSQAAQLQSQFSELLKSPYKSFHGSPTYGSVSFNYPKSWSAYVDTENTSEPINGYFHPNEVPGTQSKTAYALRVELVNTDYAQLLQQYNSQITSSTLISPAKLTLKIAHNKVTL
jgi:hypothetical protein